MNWEELISIQNVYRAWRDFSRGKRSKSDVILFESQLENELWSVHYDLRNNLYYHGAYSSFKVRDPKEQNIHKASMRDRIVHRLLYNELLPVLNTIWLDCSFSCRPNFGQHRSVRFVRRMIFRASKNYSAPFFAVKLDIKKFFENIDHDILLRLVFRHATDNNVRTLLTKIIKSYSTSNNKGLPIGNLTSQIFANIYLHELDRFVKHVLHKKFYARYADDFICFLSSKKEVDEYIFSVSTFLEEVLAITVHPKKIVVRPVDSGIDWLGIVMMREYSVLRPTTERRMFRRMRKIIRSDERSFEMVRSVVGSYHERTFRNEHCVVVYECNCVMPECARYCAGCERLCVLLQCVARRQSVD